MTGNFVKPHLTVFAPAIIVASLWQQPVQAEESVPPRFTDSERSRNIEFGKTPAVSLLAMGSDVIGLEVRNYQDVRLGKVQNLVIDIGAGRVVGLLLNLGGVLGVGNNEAIVPLAAFHYDASRKVLQMNSTQEALKASPKMEVPRWKECQQSETVAKIYRYHRVTPYFRERPSTLVHSGRPETAVNRASDDTGAHYQLSEHSQSASSENLEGDVETTARIRRDVMARPELSLGAKNVKIITVNGRVTLRGTVATETERDLVVELAQSAAPGSVDNQLRVHP